MNLDRISQLERCLATTKPDPRIDELVKWADGADEIEKIELAFDERIDRS